MKRVIAIILTVLLLAGLSLSVFAAGSTTLTLRPSSSQIRIGDEIIVVGNFSGGVTIGTFDLNITYNAGQLQFNSAEGISPAIKAGEMDVSDKGNGNIQLLYLDADGGNTGINGTDAFRLKFTVKGGNVGDTVKVDATMKTVGDNNGGGVSAGKNPASMTIAAPLSGNTFLSGLTVDNGTLSPAFNKNTTSYNISVPFSVSKINVTATAEDGTSKVSVNSPDLTAGGTTNVSVVVTAQSGAKKTYTIAVKREQDPNYKASGNNNLTSITLDKGILSPVFSKDKTAYVVWLPYEVDKITASGTAEDSKASVSVEGGSALVAGQDNKVNVICKAEDGTTKAYVITAKRALSADGTSGTVTTLSTEEIIKSIEGAKNSAVVVNLTDAPVKQIGADLFKKLSENGTVTMNIDLGKAKISFKGSDIKNTINTEPYDFTLKNESQFKDKILEGTKDDKAFVYSFNYHGQLPGYATFTFLTSFKEGEKINVYRYNDDGTFSIIAKDVVVGVGGLVQYRNNTCSDYVMTKNTIKEAKEYESVKQQKGLSAASGVPMLVLIITFVLSLVVGAVIGFALKSKQSSYRY